MNCSNVIEIGNIILNSNFFGAFTGAIITGGIAICINRAETKERKKDKKETINKKIAVIRLHNKEMDKTLTNLIEINNEMASIPSPLDEGCFDEFGQYRGRIPSNKELKEYENELIPYQDEFIYLIKKVLQIFEDIISTDIDILNEEMFESFLSIKHELDHEITPWVLEKIELKELYLLDGEIKSLKKIIDDINKIVD